MELLIDCETLASRLGDPDLRILDASAFLPDMQRNARADYLAAHIPGALFLNLPTLNDHDDPRSAMVPSPAYFAERMTALGMNEAHRIVIYDDSPLVTSARAWWLFKVMGTRNVAILDGGLNRWRTLGLPLESGEATPVSSAPFTAVRNEAMIATKAQILANLAVQKALVVDARGAERFEGLAPEPRAGITPGHIPAAVNLPYDRLLAEDGRWKQGEALSEAFADAQVDMGRPLITSCGSGGIACNLLFGAALLGKQDVTVYDGSWAEWGTDPETPKETGKTTGTA